ncbi:hypothetical protein JL107_03680 [Nakamurella flavida]|uniref:Carbohydrate kinase FGGY N-terminal domain-containing protein n=1 Tax=Nakamurella flavida TaxID=363630 RepID=A0A938YI50_9ACTN|nr:FGGY family carbohydrate kinase [Nakamurella flavida]MBM9475539.1 hypothetical protein [Nakamurella flavida]MDP9778186.1 xylulokinase [Nakamurella flavida]
MPSAARRPVSCGVDIGSTNTKVVALAADGVVVARASGPTPRDPAGLSLDVTAVLDTVDAMITRVCGETHEIHAICVVGVGEDGVLVDADRRPLGPPLAWFDPRRQGVFSGLRSRLPDDRTLDAESDPARAMVGWAWSRGQPGGDTAAGWVAVADLAAVRWAGRAFLSDTLAARTGAWRSTDRSWAADRVEATLGSTDLLPRVLGAGEIVGALRSPTWRTAGLLGPDAIVVAGGHDHAIGGWGVDQWVPGVVLDSMGTAEVAVTHYDGAPAVRPPGVDLAPGVRSAGRTVSRVEELTRNAAWAAQDPAVGTELQRILTGEQAPVPSVDSGLFLPGRRGGGRPGYAADAPRDPRARASVVLGALARLGRDAVDAVQEVVGRGREVRLAGGWSRQPGWLEIKAAVDGVAAPVIAEPEVSAVGAALLAARARGWTPSPAVALGGADGVAVSWR